VQLPSFIDGGPFDIITLSVAIVIACAKCWRHKHELISKETGFHIIHGLAIFPLLTLSISAFSHEAVTELAKSNPVILSGAGFVALLAILEDEFKKGDAL
jgi:hypothetical protein